MKLFRFASTVALSLAMVGVLAAQAPPSAAQQPPAPRAEQQQPAAQPADAAEMTVVGCLAQAQNAADGYTLTVIPAAAAAPASGPAAAAPDAVRASGSPKSEAARPAHNAAPAAAAPTSYKITGIAADQLKGHVNHHVELKGRLNAANAGASAAADADAATEFRASSVKMISATCPAAK